MLDEVPLCAWATVGADRRAHVNTGYFARSDDLELYLLSHPGSLHSRNVAANPSMAVAVYASTQRWTEPGRGLQLFGTCALGADGDRPRIERAYATRFPGYREWKTTLAPGDPALDYRFYRFVPGSVKVLDEAEFGDAVWVRADVVRDSS